MLTILTYLTFDKDANNWETIRVALILTATPLCSGEVNDLKLSGFGILSSSYNLYLSRIFFISVT